MDSNRYVKLADVTFACPGFHNCRFVNGLIDRDTVLEGNWLQVPWTEVELRAYEDQLLEWSRPFQRFVRWVIRHKTYSGEIVVPITQDYRTGNRLGWWLERHGLLIAHPSDQSVVIQNTRVRYRASQQFPGDIQSVQGLYLNGCIFEAVPE